GGVCLDRTGHGGDADVAARGLQVDVVPRRDADVDLDVDRIAEVEEVPVVELVRDADRDVVAILRDGHVEIAEDFVGFALRRRLRVAHDLDGDAGAAADDLDVANARVDRQRAAVGDVESLADGVRDRGARGAGDGEQQYGNESETAHVSSSSA